MKTQIGGLLLAAVVSASASTQVVDIQTTNTQAIVHVQTDQVGNCTYRISESKSFDSVVNDVNEALFPGSSSDLRTGAVVIAPPPSSDTADQPNVPTSDHWFLAGTRTADLALDGQWYSRALAADTPHYGGVTCGTDGEIGFAFRTSPIPYGNTFTEPVPFDRRALGNYALPTFDFTDLSKLYIDPQTGLKFRLATGPGQFTWGSVIQTATLSNTFSPGKVEGAILTGVNWSGTNQCLQVDGGFCTYTAPSQDVLTIRLAATSAPGGEAGFYAWQNTIGGPSQWHAMGIDALQANLSGNGGGSPIQVDVALSWNGVDQASQWATVTLPASTGMVSYPASLSALLAAWQGPDYPPVPGLLFQLAQLPLHVNTRGAVVTTTQGCNQYGQGGCFPLDPRILKAGSKIAISGTEYTIASVDSATQVTLASSAGTQANATAYVFNFAVMIRKHTPDNGTINLDGVTVTMAISSAFSNGASGFQQFCSPAAATDSGGHTGRFCLFPGLNSALYWVTDDLDSRFIGRAYLPASSIGVPGDEYAAAFYNGQSMFDATDPNSWYISSALRANGYPTLLKATYHPSGVPGCAVGADYRTLPRPLDWSNKLDNCNITYTEITRPSQGKDIYAQLKPALKTGKFGTPGLAFVQNGVAVFMVNGGSQDTEAWLIHVRLSDGIVSGQFSNYMNSPVASCRFCVLHGLGPSDAGDGYYYMVFNEYAFSQPTGGRTNGDGPYLLSVSTPLTTTPGNRSCAGVTDPAVTWLIPYSDGCDDITLAGADNIPCDPDPSTWEAANAGACSWHSGWTGWQGGAIQVGDWFNDPNTGYEQMVFAKHNLGTAWTVLRNVNPPQGPLMQVASGINPAFLRAHAPNWTASMHCSFRGSAFVHTSEVDGSRMIWDRKFAAFNHSVMRSQGIVSAEYYGDINDFGQSVRIGAYPGAANKKETARVRNTAAFSGKTGLSGFNFVQSHIGWDGVSGSFTDMAPIAPPGGGSFNLWPQPGVVNITGSLYKIPSANAFIPQDKRRRATAVWSGMYNFQDVSGKGPLTGGPQDNYKYCSIDYPGATCGQTNEVVGDVFMNIPQATIDGSSGGAYDFNRPNAVPLGQEPLAVLQYDFTQLTSGTLENQGRWERRLTTGFARYNGQDTYSNAKVIPHSNVLLFSCSTPNVQRTEDLCLAKMPPDTPSTTLAPGNDFVPINILVQGGQVQYAEVQFGYAENGLPDQFFCTTRQEACNTSSPAGTPFNWEGEPRVLTSCGGGCIIHFPALPDRVIYYRLRWSNDGVHWEASAPGMTVARRSNSN